MKTLFIFLIAVTSMVVAKAQETETVKATFKEHLDGVYYFTDNEDYSIEFTQIKQKVLEEFNLLGEEHKGKIFMITYTTETEEDEDGDDISIDTIVDLKRIE